MAQKTVFGLLLLAALTLGTGIAGAQEPSLHDVYQAADAGRLSEAQRMMAQVLRDHPNSAKAHFVEAELFAKEGRLGNAEAELATAERLAPGLPFANTTSVRELKELIHPQGRVGKPLVGAAMGSASPAQSSGGIPWGTVLIGLALVAIGFVVVRAMSQRSPAVVPTGMPNSGYGPSAVAQPYPYAPQGPAPVPAAGGGFGSGILGGLATGAAVGVGVVAAESLMHRMLDGHQAAPVMTPPAGLGLGPVDDDLGGTDFGIADTSSWDSGGGDGGSDWS